MQHPFSFAAQYPNCHHEVTQVPRDLDEIRRLVREDRLSFSYDFCDVKWEPSLRELANVECLLPEPAKR